MGFGTILSVIGGACTIGGFVTDQLQRKADAREAAEEVYKQYHPEEFPEENKKQKKDKAN